MSNPEILFLNAPTQLYPPNGRGNVYETIPPMGLGYVATQAKNMGVGIDLIDAEHQGLSPNQIAQIVAEKKPPILALNLMTPTVSITLEIIRQVLAQNSNIKLILGGPHAILFPVRTLRDLREWSDNILWISTWEGELPMRDFLNTGNKPSLNAAYFNDSGEIIETAKTSLSPELLNSLILDHSLLPEGGVRCRKEDGRKEGYILTSRGCPYKCAYCAAAKVAGRRIRQRSPQSIGNELKILKDLGVQHLRFVDDLFILSSSRMKEIAEILNQFGYCFTWEANGRANILSKFSDSAWDLLRKMGLKELEIGIESGSDRVLELMRKEITSEQIITTVTQAVKRQIGVKGFLMIGYPGETVDDLRQTIELVRELKRIGGNLVRFSPVPTKAYPGTHLAGQFSQLGDEFVCVSLGDDQILASRTRYNAMHVLNGEPVALSELTDGASTNEVLEALRQIIYISAGY